MGSMKTAILAFLLLILVAACTQQAAYEAKFNPTQGNSAQGTVMISKEANGILFQGTITGLPPGEHGFHIHEKGDCSAPDATSAGGHYNPINVEHGALNAEPSHIGDLGNIAADSNGIAQVNVLAQKVQLSAEYSVARKAMIIHELEDDYGQPTGNAGKRLACAVIRKPLNE